MKKETPNIHFKIKVPIYPVTILCYFGTKEFFQEMIHKHIPNKKAKEQILEYDTNYNGIVHNYGGHQILHIDRIPDSPVWHNMLAHEVLHLTFAIMRYTGMELSEDSEEAYTYLNGYVTEQIHKNIEKYNKNYTT